MKVDKSLEEVWGWKDKAYEETKGLSLAEKIEEFKKSSQSFCKKYRIHTKKLAVSQR